MYNTMQFLHVASAVVWIGSGVGILTLMGALQKAGDGAALAGVTAQMDGVGKRLFGPAAMATLLFGILTVVTSEGQWSFEDTWIVIGFAGVALSIVSVVLRNKMQSQLMAALEARGPQDPEVAEKGKRIGLINRVDLLVLFVVVWAMVVKPGS